MFSAPEEYVKIYLFALMQSYNTAIDMDMMSSFSLDEQTVLDAFAYWQKMGLVEIISTEPIKVVFKSQTMLRENSVIPEILMGKNGKIVEYLEKKFPLVQFSRSQIEKVTDWKDVFGLDEDCIFLLIDYCIKLKGKKVTINYMDVVAKSWADNGVLTRESAEDYLKNYEERISGATQILKRFRVSRQPTEDELALYDKWTKQWGFDNEAILMACSETTGAYKPSFAYLNSILETCRSNGASSSEAVHEYLKNQDRLYELARLIFERANIKRTPTKTEREQINMWVNSWHMDSEVLLYAGECANGLSSPFAQIKKFVEYWHNMGIRTYSLAKNAKPEFNMTSTKNNGSQTGRTSKKKYTDDELRAFGIDV